MGEIMCKQELCLMIFLHLQLDLCMMILKRLQLVVSQHVINKTLCILCILCMMTFHSQLLSVQPPTQNIDLLFER